MKRAEVQRRVTARYERLLGLIRAGFSTSQIAAKMGLSYPRVAEMRQRAKEMELEGRIGGRPKR